MRAILKHIVNWPVEKTGEGWLMWITLLTIVFAIVYIPLGVIFSWSGLGV